jgi:uroporphyrin-III C-methyltransferase
MAAVTVIGAGPGDPELMTRKAWRLLGEADVVLHDALMDVDGMKEAAPHAEWLSVGKRAGRPSTKQAFICSTIVALAKRGLRVVRLKGGDPSIFGRLSEELDACRAAGISVEVVPGVTSACAAAADLQASLTLRGVARSVAFITPRVGPGTFGDQDHWLQAAMAADTAVLYMAGQYANQICRQLIEAGKPAVTPICIVENASGSGARIQATLLEIARFGLPELEGPVSLMIGEAMAHAVIPDRSEIGGSAAMYAQQSAGRHHVSN